MFRIPEFYKMEMTIEEARQSIAVDGDMLAGMEHVNEMWARHCADGVDDDEVFYDTWIYEVNAYNVIFEQMQTLFA